MCAIAGIFSHQPAGPSLYDALTVLQHRGQDAAGIATSDGKSLHICKNTGFVRDVFDRTRMSRLQGSMGIAHCRYPTAGKTSQGEAQPFYVNSPYGIVLGHNGNLTNADALRAKLEKQDRRHFNTQSDSEVIINLLARELEKFGGSELEPAAVFKSVAALHTDCRGAYAVIALVVGQGILAFRDQFGIRPLVLGRRGTSAGDEYMVASESVALDMAGFELERDVAPGEAVFIDMKGRLHASQCAPKNQLLPCLFEFVYLARPDSLLDDTSVYSVRVEMGKQLAKKIIRENLQDKFDVIVPVPDSGRIMALSMAQELGLQYREGFVKNHYVGRTFIMPDQKLRQQSVKRKLNLIVEEFAGKRVLLVDDSIIRGTTSRQLVQLARDAGATTVGFASAAPPVRFPNVYGIDMPTKSELLAHNRTESEIADWLLVDQLIYQDLDSLKAAVTTINPKLHTFEASCFDGEYITGDIDNKYLDQLALARGESTRKDTPLALPLAAFELHTSFS